MNLLILDGRDERSVRKAQYRGTDRRAPTYCDLVARDHEINRLFMWYLEEGGEAGVVHDLSKAKRYAELCNLYLADRHFEVVEFRTGREIRSEDIPQLLGFDLSEGGCGHSLIWMALLYEPKKRPSDDPAFVLGDPIRRQFLPRLNEFGLFSSRQDALDCRRAMNALQDLRPGLYEGESLEVFRVSAIHLHWPLVT